jgi:hypothetical protein
MADVGLVDIGFDLVPAVVSGDVDPTAAFTPDSAPTASPAATDPKAAIRPYWRTV